MERTPSLRVPVVARLVGRGAAEARRILAERQPGDVGHRGPGGGDGKVGDVVGAHPSPAPSREGRGRRPRPPPSPRRGGGGGGPCQPVARHTRHRAGHHRPHGPHACGTDARLRHKHRRRHLDALGCEGSRRRACVRQLPRRRDGNRRGRLGRDGAATGNTGRRRGGAGRRHPAHRHGGRGHSAARRDSHRPRGSPCRRHLDRRLHARHGDPRRNQARLPA